MGRIEPKAFVLRDGRSGIIRTAQECDGSQVLSHIDSVLAEAEYTVTTLDDDSEDYTIEKITEWIKKHAENEGHLIAVAEIGGRIVGSVDFHNGQRKRIEHVGSLAIIVHKDYRRLGVGQALMESVIEWAAEQQVIEKIGLGVFSNNVRAINLYKKLGFIEEGRRVKEIKIGPDNYIDSILMYKMVR
jgi:RimJ/RimL family protein N-acetyltransferase